RNFKDGNTNPGLNDYEYDANGNMVKDRNKGITNITYNHLNLPVRITISSLQFIDYQNNATGVKVSKTVTDGDGFKKVDYQDGFQYAGEVLQFFPHSEGYVSAIPNVQLGSGVITGYTYKHIFHYTYHLGNVRLSFSTRSNGRLEVMNENHYYPFGMKHSVYVPADKKIFGLEPGEQELKIKVVTKTEYLYEYNGKEWQDELGLSWYDYGARNYDAALGRWMNMDPMAPKYFSHSTYAYALNAPTYFIDPDGMQVMGNGDPDDDCKGCPAVELETAVIIANKKPDTSKSTPESSFDFTSFIFGRDGKRSIHLAYTNMNSLEHIVGFKKMIDAKREGELGVAILFSIPYAIVATPAVIAYGSMAIETSYGSFIIRASVDAGAQYITKGEVDIKQTAINGIIPTNTAKNLTGNILANAGNNFYNNASEPNLNNKLSLGQNIQETTIKAISGALINGIGIPADGIQSFHIIDSAIGIGSNFIDTQIENDIRD
ncbi:MAG: RHS repeat-associated core domain-containing protein, partial [Weeksellaceae bacterium]